MSVQVYVVNKNGNPLMPCKPAKARHLLRDGKAKVIGHKPFTIQLNWDCEENVQDVTVGIDKGSKVTGFSCVAHGKVLMSGEIHHRQDIKDKMEARANNRRQRRNRKWYRPARFKNRASSKRSGRIPPSIKATADEVIQVIKRLPLPISQIIVEDVQIDIARLNDATLNGKEYQKSNRTCENLRMATLIRDDFTCQCCGAKNARLEAHHIVWRSNGGKDTIKNLITLCSGCHEKVHSGDLELDIDGVDGLEDRIAQRTMQGKTYMYGELSKIAPVSTVYGYQTSAWRKKLELEKTHATDAMCIATLHTGEIVPIDRDNFYAIKFRPRQTRRQYHDLPKKSKGRVRYQVNTELDGFRKGDIVRVKGYVKQINSIYSNGSLAFPRIKGEPASAKPKNCELIRKTQTIIFG